MGGAFGHAYPYSMFSKDSYILCACILAASVRVMNELDVFLCCARNPAQSHLKCLDRVCRVKRLTHTQTADFFAICIKDQRKIAEVIVFCVNSYRYVCNVAYPQTVRCERNVVLYEIRNTERPCVESVVRGLRTFWRTFNPYLLQSLQNGHDQEDDLLQSSCDTYTIV